MKGGAAVRGSCDARGRPSVARILLACLLAATLGIASVAHAQIGGAEAPAADALIRASAKAVRIPAGGSAIATIEVAVQPGWHVNANPPSPDYMIPTEVVIEPAGGVTAGKAEYPEPVPLAVGFEKEPILTFGGTIVVRIPLLADRDDDQSATALNRTVSVQASNAH